MNNEIIDPSVCGIHSRASVSVARAAGSNENPRRLRGLARQLMTASAFASMFAALGGGCNVEDEGRDLHDDNRIIGGQPVDIVDVPWQVALRLEKKEGKEDIKYFFCGGTVVGERWVLTSTQCMDLVSEKNLEKLDVVAGISVADAKKKKHEDEDEVANPHKQIRRVTDISSSNSGLLTLLKLAEPLDLSSDGVAAIDFATEDDGSWIGAGAYAVMSGFGMHEAKDEKERKKKKAYKLKLQPLQWVAMELEPSIGQIINVEAAQGVEQFATCAGDLGGPLVVDSDRGPLLAGVAYSYEDGCEGHAASYIDLSSHSEWIHATIGNSSVLDSFPNNPLACESRCNMTEPVLAGCSCNRDCEDEENGCCWDYAPACVAPDDLTSIVKDPPSGADDSGSGGSGSGDGSGDGWGDDWGDGSDTSMDIDSDGLGLDDPSLTGGEDEGCSCRGGQAPTPAAWMLGLLGLVGLRRRRR